MNEIKEIIENWFGEHKSEADEEEKKDLGHNYSAIISDIDIKELVRRVEEWLDK